ncbi:MAG TPA: thioredoxin family protein [Xanthobacteraceae bacterium]|jgi:peroxiredoxin|nr:thioredoxin family protein [Xanthobacteraceae bacterium]
MVETAGTICKFGWKAQEFALKGTDGRTWRFADVRGSKGTLVIFLSNTCPYVLAVIRRIVEEAKALQEIGIGVIGIMSNVGDPRDSLDAMKEFASQNAFSFPYAEDPTQEVARAYDAQCTPDFFGFNAKDELQYRGRLDASRRELVPGARRDLFEAMKQIANTGQGPAEQIPSMGCGIKWRENVA